MSKCCVHVSPSRHTQARHAHSRHTAHTQFTGHMHLQHRQYTRTHDMHTQHSAHTCDTLVQHTQYTHTCSTYTKHARNVLQAASGESHRALPISSQQGTALQRLWRTRTLLPEATSTKDELTLRPARSAYCVTDVALGASGAGNEEKGNVSSFETQLPPKPLEGEASPRASTWPLTLRRLGEESCSLSASPASD